MIPFLAAHWKPMLISAAVAAGATWFLKPDPQPAVTLKEEARTAATEQARMDQTVKAGPVKVTQTIEDFGDGTGPGATLAVSPAQRESPAGTSTGEGACARTCPPLIRRTVTVTEQGPTTTTTHAETAASQSSERKLDLTVTPQARAGWALQVGLEDVLHGGEVRVAVRRRLLGPFWAEAAALPRTRAVGVGLWVEW